MRMRLFYIGILGTAAISLATAGQIEIGAGQNGSGVSTQGLTSAYIGATTWGEKNYVNNLFLNDTLSNGTLNNVTGTGPTGNGSTLPTAGNGFQQFTDTNDNVTFGMMNDGSNGMNYWGSTNPNTVTPSSITVPVEVSGVSTAYIMLSDYYGLSGASGVNNDTVEFFFSGGGNLSFNLSNGVQIDSVHNCLGSNASAKTPEPCPSPSFSGTTTAGTTDMAWSGTYAEANNATPYSGTQGNVSLLDLSFSLGDFSGQTLTSVQITDNNDLSLNSRLALSAITVSGANAQLVTPEPSTVFLFLAGLGAIGFFGHRRKVRL